MKHEAWMRHDLAIMRHAAQVYLLPLEGWMESKGIVEELSLARACGLALIILQPGIGYKVAEVEQELPALETLSSSALDTLGAAMTLYI